MEAEWAEMVASLLICARQTNHLQFGLVGPDNEMDQTPQGVNMTAAQYATALHELSQILDTNGLSDLRFVGPDMAVGGTTYLPEMLADPVVMSKVAHFGMHGYSPGGVGSDGVYNYLQSTDYPDRNFWMTESGAWCAACDAGMPGTYDWTYCKQTVDYLMRHLLNNASAELVWEVYDSQYNYYNPLQWSFWGLFGVDDINAVVRTYTPRKTFYTLAQLSKFVRPGAQRIGVSDSTSSFSPLLAFKHAGLGQITIVGINTSGSAATLSGTLASLPTVPRLNLYYTSATANLTNGGSVAVINGSFSARIPADSVFTLTGYTRVLTQLAVTPTNATVAPGRTQQFKAIGTYSDGSTSNLTSRVSWRSSSTGVATISAYGMARGMTAGMATISATLGSVGGNTTLMIQQPPLAITTASLPSGTVSNSYATKLVASRGRSPYTWSLADGALPPGLTLSLTGAISGKPTTAGTFSFTVLVTDASTPAQTATRLLSLTIKSAVASGLIGNAADGALADPLWSNGAWIKVCRFQVASNMTVSTMRAKVAAIPGRYKCAIYSDVSSQPGRLLGSTAEVSNPASGWQSFALASSVVLTKGSYCWLAIWSSDANAGVYYSGNNGTARWGRYNYGTWPYPISLTGGGSFNYCINAR
jgi:hypothetical protein